MTTPPLAGEDVYLGSILTNVHLWGIISDLDTPAMMSGSFEILGNDGAITLDALVGQRGIPGQNAPIVDMQWEDIDDPADLPDNLTDDPGDVGKAWWIGNQVYVWDGTSYQAKAMGTPGPPGPVPNITPSVELLDPDDIDLETSIEVTGTATNPGWHMKLKVPKGPTGAAGPIRDAADYDDSVPPVSGDAICWNGVKYAPAPNALPGIMCYSVPEANFTNFTGITTRQQIASFAIPPQNYDFQTIVWGHIRAVGVEADSDPLILGCEVRLGNATSGTLIARGFGNSSTWTTIVPHFSAPGSPSDAITPENGLAVVHAGVTGTAATIYANLFNDGISGVYAFDRRNAALFIQCIPV
jgi:hypothetical protein